VRDGTRNEEKTMTTSEIHNKIKGSLDVEWIANVGWCGPDWRKAKKMEDDMRSERDAANVLWRELYELAVRATVTPFRAKYAGTCALTGLAFSSGDFIRPHQTSAGTLYTADRGYRAADLRSDPAPDAIERALERSRPFDAELALSWLAEGRVVVLVKRTGAEKVIDGRRSTLPSAKQFAARTRAMVWMIRREVIR
jgi:hypothetical protein